MSSSNVISVVRCAESGRERHQAESSVVQVAQGKCGGKSSEELRTAEDNKFNSSTSHPAVGAGKPPIVQRKHQYQKKPSSDLQKGFVKFDQADPANSKHSNQSKGSGSNLVRGPSKNTLIGKMNNMSIDPRRVTQNGFQRNNHYAGQANASRQNFSHNNWRAQNQTQQQHSEGVSQNRHNNIPSPSGLSGYPPNNHFSTPQYQRNQGSPPHMQQAFPPPPYMGNDFYRPYLSGYPPTNHFSTPQYQRNQGSPPHMQQAFPPPPYMGNDFYRPYKSGPVHAKDFPVTGSPRFSARENFSNFNNPSGSRSDFLQCPPPNMNGSLSNQSGYVSPANSYSSQGGSDMEPRNQQNVTGKKFKNGSGTFEGHNQKKQGIKPLKKNNQFVPPMKPVSIPVTQGGPMIMTRGPPTAPMNVPEQQTFPANHQVIVSQPNFGPMNSIPPPIMSPAPSGPYHQYVGQPQYVAFYPGGNYIPQQQWVPITELQGNFVPYANTEIVPYTMGPGVIPQNTVPYSVQPNMMPYPNRPVMVPYTSHSGHGTPPAAPPMASSNVNAHLVSLTISSQNAPLSAPVETHPQFNLSQLEEDWEDTPVQEQLKQEASTEPSTSDEAVVPTPEAAGPSQPQTAGSGTADDQHQHDGSVKMLDVAMLEELLRNQAHSQQLTPTSSDMYKGRKYLSLFKT